MLAFVVLEVSVPPQFPSMQHLFSRGHDSSWRKHQINKASAATAPPNFPLSESSTDFFLFVLPPWQAIISLGLVPV